MIILMKTNSLSRGAWGGQHTGKEDEEATL